MFIHAIDHVITLLPRITGIPVLAKIKRCLVVLLKSNIWQYYFCKINLLSTGCVLEAGNPGLLGRLARNLVEKVLEADKGKFFDRY